MLLALCCDGAGAVVVFADSFRGCNYVVVGFVVVVCFDVVGDDDGDDAGAGAGAAGFVWLVEFV